MKRPSSLAFIGWLAIIAGAVEAIVSLAYLGISGLVVPFVTVPALAVGGTMTGIGLVTLLFGVLGITFGVGALQERSWSWAYGISLYVLNAVLAVVLMGVAGLSAGLTIGTVGGLIVSVVILGYLYSETVREALGHSAHHGPTMQHPTPA